MKNKDLLEVEDYLSDQGITFEPLRSELMDHLVSDLENRLEKEMSFEQAWRIVQKEIPENHLKNLEKETMEVLKFKFNIVKVLANFSIGFLILGALFKLLHLQFAGELMVSFFVCSAITILAGAVQSTFHYKEKKGRAVMYLMAFLLLSFVSFLIFRLLHWPGGVQLQFFSVISLATLLPAISVYFFWSSEKLKDHLIIHINKRNQNMLENLSMVLICFGFAINYAAVYSGQRHFIGDIFFLYTLILTGLLIYSKTWIIYVDEIKELGRNTKLSLLIISSLALVLFLLPLLGGNLGGDILRNFMVFGSFALFIMISTFYFHRYSASEYRHFLAPISSFLFFYPFLRLGTNLNWFEGWLGNLLTNPNFNIGFLVFLGLLLLIFRKERIFKLLIILVLSLHMIPNI
ncbi:MAG: hypothetical protein JXR07_12845 [Reichenbachiella sp.]